ncbi:MAG: acetoin utilization protein AcuB [Polyangiales bacterium]|jgi:acetoin utilization protein AcuB
MSNQIQPIHEIMSQAPETIGSEQSIASAAVRMRELGVRHLPVLYGGRLAGVISDRDIAFISSFSHVDPEQTKVEEAMTPEPFIVGPSMPVGHVARQMADRKLGSALVVEGDKVVGIVTTTDALSLLADMLGAAKTG